MNLPPPVAALLRTLAGPDYPPARPLPGPPAVRRYAGPTGILAVGIIFAITLAEEHDRALPLVIAILFAGLTVAPLAALRRRPLLAWRLLILALALCTFNAPARASWPWNPALVLIGLLVLAVVALRVDWPLLPWIGGITLVPVVALVDANNVVGVIVLVVLLLVVGGLIRRTRQSGAALAEQTELSELEKARRAVLEERARIARELHDVVAHHMSMIAVQAETAPYRLDALPDPARAEFGAIAGSAREALTDMRRLLGVLRNADSGPQTAPQPGLAELPELLAGARRAGMTVELAGPLPVPDAPDRPAVPAPVQLAAYRIIQEAVANAARHAPGAPVRLAVRATGAELEVRVDNAHAGPAARPGAAGHGLTGMRERAVLLGGAFSAGPTGEGFVVHARLPYEPEGDR
ncbi:sensor histidine kinase [Plantactinospora siamensis]|uniref:histidine kinase n=1 Tax=Plantactinospora siamensis TaxID=555372 RepID=A0ABV6NYX3_9ACTN